MDLTRRYSCRCSVEVNKSYDFCNKDIKDAIKMFQKKMKISYLNSNENEANNKIR